jgi:hypothetical protein
VLFSITDGQRGPLSLVAGSWPLPGLDVRQGCLMGLPDGFELFQRADLGIQFSDPLPGSLQVGALSIDKITIFFLHPGKKLIDEGFLLGSLLQQPLKHWVRARHDTTFLIMEGHDGPSQVVASPPAGLLARLLLRARLGALRRGNGWSVNPGQLILEVAGANPGH